MLSREDLEISNNNGNITHEKILYISFCIIMIVKEILKQI